MREKISLDETDASEGPDGYFSIHALFFPKKPAIVFHMKAAAESADLGGGLACWSAYDASNKVDLCASAVAVGGRLYFVDPIPLRPAALAELTANATPTGIVLTNANHARAAAEYRQRFSIPICYHRDAMETIGLDADLLIEPGVDSLFDGALRVVPLAGAAPGEIALFRPALDGGALIVGDALIHLGSHGFAVLPDKYCTNAKGLRRSLAGLLELPFSQLLFAHGEPILTNARARLQTLLTP